VIGSPKGNTTLGILCLITATIAAFQVSLFDTMSLNSNVKRARVLSARDALDSHIRTYASLGATFRSSMHPGLLSNVNSELRNCIFGTGPTDCQANVATPVSLYYPMSSTDAFTSAHLSKITGPSAADPVFYDIKGQLCELKSDGALKEASCPFFEVSTTFVATCPAAAAACPTAQSLAVTYTIQAVQNNASAISFPMAKVEASAVPVPRADILPATLGAGGKIGSSGNNVTVTLITTTAALTLDTIKGAFEKAGIKNSQTLTNLTNAFYNSGITDLSKIPFLAKVGITDSKWMKLVVESEITDRWLAQMLFYTDNDWTPKLLADSVKAVDFLPEFSYVKFAFASRTFTDPAEVKRINDNLAYIDNQYISGGIIRAGFYEDTEKISKVLAAVTEVTVPQVAGALAGVGVTDKALANQNAAIVSVIDDDNLAGNMIYDSKGVIAKTQGNVDSYLSYKPPEEVVEIPVVAGPTTPSTPETLSLVPTCSNVTCTTVTY
jgi:hypothetical protein